MSADNIKKLIERYINSLLSADEDTLHQCIADEITIDSGTAVIHTADDFTAMCRFMPRMTSWKILDISASKTGGAVLYETISADTGDRLRIAEFLTVRGGKIISSRSVYMTFPTIDMIMDE